MEATAAASATSVVGRAGPLPMTTASTSASRKEWRAVSESQPSRSATNEDLERQKVGQVDERTIHEQGRQPVDLNFCAITIDATSEDEVLRQLEGLVRKRKDLQQLEIQLRAQMIAKSEISEMKSEFDAQIKEYADNGVKLQEKLHEREQLLRDLERKIDEKDREILAMKRDNEAAWAKEDLLREQKKELASFRRERDHSEAERLQHIQQIHELQEHAQDKERQLMELQEQYRVTQEAIIYKDEQLREAQAWIARVQEMDALQSHSLQAELRERTEQCNQLWLVWQRQFAEMEGFHLHRIQQLQVELADLRERNGSLSDDSSISQPNMKDGSQLGPSKGNQHDVNGSLQNEHVPAASLGPSTLVGLSAYIPSGQVNAFYPYAMNQQGVPHSVNSKLPPSEVGQYPSVPLVSPVQQWHNQQGASAKKEVSKQEQVVDSQTNQKPVNGDVFQRGNLDVPVSLEMDHKTSLTLSTRETQVTDSIDGRYSSTSGSQLEAMLPDISSNFHHSLSFDNPKQSVGTQEHVIAESIDSMTDEQGSESEHTSTLAMSSPLIPKNNEVKDGRDIVREVVPDVISVGPSRAVSGAISPALDCSLLDERSLLACVVRTIPAGGGIRISSTLPNRLSKMLAPLHWHDYKKTYGKLDEFVASHPELFVIEGDYIQLREGAQEMIAAKAAEAKVAAAAAASATYSSALPTVAVTPLAQARRQRIAPPINGKHHYQNGVRFNVDGATSSIKILTKAKDSLELNVVKATEDWGPILSPDLREGQVDISQLYVGRLNWDPKERCCKMVEE
ncbi:hypothetical protein MLD38_030455 [Melastoma candidum]|uniref:Uncharacterized protein n=1 Tax=Melastoma candidum TaxID=119954 RepID=A0ACB9MN84_9MYRT|nr:hypothetical protein MLD38_030455 [Melastoma candidum]